VGGSDRGGAIRKAWRIAGGLLVAALISISVGEIGLRLYYWDGTSFGMHAGPLVARFERDFRFNRYDGPSRGPETDGQKAPGAVRILVQGDSITWGQGVKPEADLYTSRLLRSLQDAGSKLEMAVLAYPGRDLDEHLEQLKKWGEELDPDVIIYQWYMNDMDLDGSTRIPPHDWNWRIDRVHGRLAPYSYLYFLTDYSLGVLLDPLVPAPSYTERMARHFAADGEPWRSASAEFARWVALARSLTPRVLVAIYPQLKIDPGEPPRMEAGMEELQGRFEVLCQREGVGVVDLGASLRSFEDSRQLKATTFDGHPSAAAHRAMAEQLEAALEQEWPDLFERRH
jgi:lysophospholipase L1-like esterase